MEQMKQTIVEMDINDEQFKSTVENIVLQELAASDNHSVMDLLTELYSRFREILTVTWTNRSEEQQKLTPSWIRSRARAFWDKTAKIAEDFVIFFLFLCLLSFCS
jgi:hypothetical protein